MSKKELINLIENVIFDLEELKKSRQENNLDSIITLYKKTLLSLESGKLQSNIVKNMTRGYLEIYNDYDNPALNLMYTCEKELDKYIKL
ncbi:hypothetical protein [Xenorhabdus cabanillasii]|uniref:Uncharacterized protein n=1 Tax=Xenorhabdus cabanillasii JM26 TaxID=1427517 RepID=W1IX40_9GAMM|nr:hypothetical protein [Xenorhabdus cabanillasii]PHM77204.1 hypothetical protein Xcab_02247 [Xenorhabdus cabanillasii JM26]CDL81780.1 conserved hypothetical protein [Xenorhabdus cabanillasii JM26]